MKFSNNLKLIIILALFVISCKTEPSIQHYIVDHQETVNFTAIDVPTSVVPFDENTLSKNQKEALKSVRKLNFLGYRMPDTTDVAEYNAELKKVKALLKSNEYTELFRMNDKQANILVKYLGSETDDTTDELIALVNSNTFGFGIIRVLGDDMDPYKMAELSKALENTEINDSRLQGFKDFLDIKE